MYVLAMQAAESGLTLESILRDIPLTPGSVITYAIFLGGGFLLWWANRPEVIRRYAERRAAERAAEEEGTRPAVRP
ncbi:MAG: hypothetical protein JO040_08045 [Gemmatimonadetes bacterium]|nr:hypothetical protein [Gemmatimonadota bacterium]